ncbi:SubName: Full=Uncharacterized protein {ECO:0000313/EMBL:CCA70389.1} [Serendipita indica DSM 11827]|uniref:Mediator of RNA polymerase II transcription subunit 31 n=1 Tax=Serendipita indica (strain DSM 11827) TaxID=1109443 RepID=G4TGF2_SERID|nr:SubName: Full=Uncharacterized protein {ECO:0000313/EMBL:CCA70389.1} [Serendipita indica DSM 11827]CCA70389.1 hypothetical protein PIIN_04328 [Serendipita indica DSM 11827]
MSDDQNQETPSIEPAPRSSEKIANKIRFETELEFVQCLANPHYLASLATQGLLSQPNFIAYLKYLTYWLDVEKGFGRFIVYPHALHHLALLQQPSFREALKDPELRMRLEREQYLHWRTWRTSEPAVVPTRARTAQADETTDAATPGPTRPTRRSGTARSSGVRTPAGRTPRSVRTPGTGIVRTPAIGVRTPAARSTLSVSTTIYDHSKEVATPPRTMVGLASPGLEISPRDSSRPEDIVMLSPEKTSPVVNVAPPTTGDPLVLTEKADKEPKTEP